MEYTTTLLNQKPIVITIGNFDGIHKGHQYLMHALHTMAEQLDCTPVVVTFSPHTLMVVRPDLYIRYLTTLEEKLALTRQFGGISDTIVIHFTPEVAAMSATDFMDSLCNRFTIRGLVVGANFSLGHKRMGDVAFLEKYGQEHDIQIQSVPLEEVEQARISSTRIRTLVSEGNISEANELLGHPLIVSGIVQHGDKRGRLLGFPTANLRPDPHKLLPANGIYAAYVRVQDDMDNGPQIDMLDNSTIYNAAVSIGIRPMFGGKECLVEAYLLDTSLDLYDKVIVIDLIARLRDEERFANLDALIAQISTDVENTRQILATRRVSN
jgi:riboflavin kinase/FMN adenylyltransferase